MFQTRYLLPLWTTMIYATIMLDTVAIHKRTPKLEYALEYEELLNGFQPNFRCSLNSSELAIEHPGLELHVKEVIQRVCQAQEESFYKLFREEMLLIPRRAAPFPNQISLLFGAMAVLLSIVVVADKSVIWA